MDKTTDRIRRYRMNAGSWAWLVHRISGMVLAGYLALHILVLSSIRDKTAFERFIAMTDSLPMRLLELALMGTLAAHALNGLRLMLLEAGLPSRYQKPLLGMVTLLLFLLMSAGGYIMLGGGR